MLVIGEMKYLRMNLMFDVIIVSKDRYDLLFKQIERVIEKISYNKIIVIDSTEVIPNWVYIYYKFYGIEYYHTPNVKLGYARQIGLNAVSTSYFFMVDDDIIFKKCIAKKLYDEIMKYGSDVFAISPIILFGTNEDILSVYRRKKIDSEGVSSGACLINKCIVDSIGGFNTKIHIGEDAELFYRAKKRNYRWIRKHSLFVRHSGNDVEFIFRSWRHRKGKLTGIAYGIESYHGTIIKRIKSIFISILGLVKHRNFRATMFFICNDVIAIVAFIRGIIGGKDYALHKKKIV